MRLIPKFLVFIIGICLVQLKGYSQDSLVTPVASKDTFEQKDIKDWIAAKRSKPPKPVKDNYLLLMPYISSNPTAGFMIGTGLNYSFKKSKSDERLSLVAANISYSTNHLLNFNIKTDIFILNERLILNGDWRILKSSETTYGLGTKNQNSKNTGINGYETSDDSLGQALRYNQVRIHETGSWKFFPNFFAGLGIQYDHYYSIKDQKLENNDTASSYHYQYSKAHRFNPQQYTSSGFAVNFLYDSRDNQVNAYKGYYANVNYLIDLTGMGSSANGTILLTEFRSFHSLDKKSRNVIAFWLYGKYVVSGEVPYLQLPALGYDQRQRTGRGYTYGRFRGENLMYGELEYRFPISMRSGILGGVAFMNTTSVSDKKNSVDLLEYFKIGYGGGLRIMMDKTSRTRLAIDVGVANRVVGFYLAAQEAF